MDIDYQQKYYHLQSLCKKQQKTIAKLQLQIRQRCQSYLLHSSRHKIPQNNQERINVDFIYSSSPSAKINNLQESIFETVSQTFKIQDDQNLMKSGFSCESVITKRTNENFVISSQVNITQYPNIQKQLEKTQEKINYQQIINGFKDRIVRIQQQKNKSVKEIQHLQQQLTISNKKKIDLEKKIEISEKQYKKIKSKLLEVNQVQDITLQIYQSVRQKFNLKNNSQQLQEFNNKKLKQKLNLILYQIKSQIQNQIIQQKIKQQKKVELYEQVHEKVRDQKQLFQKIGLKQQKMIQIQADKQQQEVQYQLIKVQFQVTKAMQIIIKPTALIKQTQIQLSSQKLCWQNKQQILKILSQKQVQIASIKNQFKSLCQKQIQNKKIQYQNEIKQLNKQLEQQKQKILFLKQQEIKLEQQNLTLTFDNMQKLKQISNLSLQIQRMKRQSHQLNLQKQKLKQELENLKIVESHYESTKNELDRSRSIIDDLQSSKLAKQLKEMKQSLTKSRKIEVNDSLNNSGFKIVQQLEEPYYVEEQLQNDMNHEYVKRSFIRKKIVRRNLSATAYRVVSKSKEQVDEMIKSKVSQYADKSLQKSKKINQSAKKMDFKSNLKDQRISELSEQNRDSGYFNNIEQVVKIIQVTTKTPREQITTTKISSKNLDQNKSFRKRYEP